MSKDYIKNKNNAEQMAETIMDWYHSRGFTGVKIWVETEAVKSPYGSNLPPNHYIRGNVCYDVASIPNGMIE